MSKVKIQGHASGTGILTVTAPNTSTDRTITLPDATGTLATTADSVGGATGVDFNDNVKIRAGTGNDLEIYHDGSHTRVQNNTGNYNIRTGVFNVTNVADNESMILANADGAVSLSYDNSVKIATTSSGVTVTGATNSTVMPTFNSVDVVSKGSNSNGFYIKLAGGGLICSATFNQGGATSGTAGGYYASTNTSWTYPVAFSSNPYIVVSTEGGHWNHIAGKASSVGTTTAQISTLNPTSTNNSQGCTAIAIGQWQ